MEDAKERIRERLDIAEVIGQVVALKPAGRGQLKGLCPFHSEKTPSFHVNVDRGFYYCYGCQAGGDVFKFVMETQGLSFGDTLRQLGERVGVEVGAAPQAAKERHDFYRVNQLALAFFRSQLTAEPEARDYLRRRKLTDESVEAFELGYAPAGWDGLLKHALTKGVREDDLLALGLVIENERGRRYDRFRSRLMFPIKDRLGRLVGFSGRVLDDSLPKYMNSPESALFRKSELLYGLDRARNAIRASGEVVVVEGYTDVIALHQSGIGNAVAALGATLTEEQAESLARLDAHTVFLAFDADEAGQKAVLSGLDQAVGRRLMVKAVRVPHGKDPAEAVLDGHLDEFKLALSQGVSEVEFRFQRVLERYDPGTVDGQRQILEELQGVLRPRELFDPVASEMRRLVIDRLAIAPARLDEWLASRTAKRPSALEVRGMRGPQADLDQTRKLEAELVTLLLLDEDRLPELARFVAESLAFDLASGARSSAGATRSLLEAFVVDCLAGSSDPRSLLHTHAEGPEAAVIFSRLLEEGGATDQRARIDIDGQVDKALSRLRELQIESEKATSLQALRTRLNQIQRELTAGDLAPAALAELYEELRTVQGGLMAREAERRSRASTTIERQRRRGR
ncbi:MAG: DNA primase [Trueperaceae bacterium]|nr:DNA primase [Trueperaceae bacterium]